jgi:hypothetical protein
MQRFQKGDLKSLDEKDEACVKKMPVALVFQKHFAQYCIDGTPADWVRNNCSGFRNPQTKVFLPFLTSVISGNY